MENKEVYVVSYGFYNEWAYECGSHDILGVFTDIDKAIDRLKEYAIAELEDDEYKERLINGWYQEVINLDNIDKLDETLEKIKNAILESDVSNIAQYIDVYTNEDKYKSGDSWGVLTITRQIIE